MREIHEKFKISSADYDELNSKTGRWSKDMYAYWVAKFKSNYPAEGYGLYGVETMKEKDNCYITWWHYDSCD